jgi:ribosome biogenesis GTPase
VQPVRETDQKGRHTTKHRQLIRLPSGGLIIDTPGMRELELWEADLELGGTFGDVEALAVQCRFTNCGHVAEPGCAVRRAVEQGQLNAGRLAGYHKLKSEVQHFERKQGRRARDEESRRLKMLKSGLTVWKKSGAEEEG